MATARSNETKRKRFHIRISLPLYVDLSVNHSLRFGAEYVMFLNHTPVALRGGYWREPFHSVIRRIDDSQVVFEQDTFGEPFFSRSFKQSTNHVTFGGGVVFKHVSADVAFDYSKDSTRFIASTVVYF